MEDRSCAGFDVLFRGMFDKVRLVELIRNFLCFSKDGKQSAKILGAYHQFYAVRKAVLSTVEAARTDGKGGVFWHTQGSGKSFSMVFFSKLLQQAMSSPTIVVLTDRNDLDGQLYRQFARCEDFLRQKPVQAKSRAHLKELLAGANFYLQRLTDRYELECQAGSLTILLRDFHQGGSARPACTLSGGESFLVSLSLALGLSSLSRQSLSVDTLFIDEGFGTLSSDYLNTVMDTLEKLHQMGGKKVGIISHVEGLKERIKTQIQVRRIDSSRSEIKVVNTL